MKTRRMAKRSTNRVDSGAMPEHVDPMLCTLVKAPVENEEYLYEIKWDGYRIISKVENGKIRMNSRSGLDYTKKYPLIAEALENLGHELMIDGEIVVLNEEGKPDFDALQLYNGKRSPIRYCVFDLLFLDGNNLMELPLFQRKELLETLVKNDETFLFSESFEDGKELYENALQDNLEGIVAKKKHSPYVPGDRSYNWLKVPTRKRQEFVIGGWSESDKSRSFRALLFGAYENGKLHWIGRSGGGYKQSEMPGILKMLQAVETEKSPFVNEILDTKGAKTHYVKPTLVANFEFATWTKSGRIRKPATFLGFRKDKNPKDVVREVPKEADQVEAIIVEQTTPYEYDQNQSRNGYTPDDPAQQNAGKSELETYRQKRSFNQTPEPQGGNTDSEKLIFVVQKHDASHLHYDFRLEMRGVLKSWAVPKGPSMNPKDHRLAMAVEDHPYDYKDFEGIIPEGQYGGGTVLVWDNRTYEPAEKIKGKSAQEHWLLSHYYKNSLSIILHGKKLKGEFNLTRIKEEEEGRNSWLLTKVKDGHELQMDITKKDRSVISGNTLLEVAVDNHSKVWQSNRTTHLDQPEENDKESLNPEQLDEDEHTQTSSKPQHKHQTVGELFPKSKNKRSTRGLLSKESNWCKVFEEKIKSEGTIEVEKQSLQLTNIEKKLWKSTNKAQLINYYNSVAAYVLPYLKNRPLFLHIKNLSAQAPGFYIKDMEGHQPDFLDIFSTKRKHKVAGKANLIDYAVCNNLPALIWLINLGCVDLNPWNSTTKNPLEPDFIAIDLDPSDEDFKKTVKTALAAKEYFDEHKLTAFVKTSGKTGIHIFIPCKGFSFPQARNLAEHICAEIQKRVPKIATIEVSIDHRGNKLFVDFSQNDEADTLACAYSVRPAKLPTVSTPLEWDELTLKLKPTDFTIDTINARLLEKGDLWTDLLDKKITARNTKILKKLLEA
ncbi:DNA ligase D-like protein (predicted ligase)/DNA ligase D-like protein (predicted 3'-phosphoesterase)/DNA ligase D-like protein (predicted polymerase) [Pedobacter sp. W3I1]|uniref:non-homologous end-joining DNA ligase n=1 Tax=Pedobacter sp. W3I1 TaxID=3042291 RepID=UPI0027880E26|nr:non-homologous end-joining DNA ligase [Pedobacter sp. W3I1]MDQ0640045.1 DNA ligase D-like protein (predicted ligase)/DNA ligase D-like protein (predicted 3'-phosphoesterase)/DNA ligase D-like protein (predicted polymerase) [Pedobacter sp. W3I1]